MSETQNDYDAIVVGAGPAGSTTARFIAKEGFKVKILDARKHIGIPVRCGEAIGKETINDILKIGVPKDALRSEVHGFRVFSPSLKKIDYRLSAGGGYVVDRRIFDKELLVGAALEGADVQLNTRVTGMKIDKEKSVTLKAIHNSKEITETDRRLLSPPG